MREIEDPGFRRTDPITKYINTSSNLRRSDADLITVPARGHITESLCRRGAPQVRLDSRFPCPSHHPSSLQYGSNAPGGRDSQ